MLNAICFVTNVVGTSQFSCSFLSFFFFLKKRSCCDGPVDTPILQSSIIDTSKDLVSLLTSAAKIFYHSDILEF